MNLNSPPIFKKNLRISMYFHNAFLAHTQEKHAGGDNLIAFAIHVM